MKIVWATPLVPYPPRDGGSIRIYHLLKALADRHSVRLLALHNGDGLTPSLARLREICSSVEIFPLPPQPPRWSWPWWRALWESLRDPGFRYFTPRLHARLQELCVSGEADVVLLETMKLAGYGRQLRLPNIILCRQNYQVEVYRRMTAVLPLSKDKFAWWLGTTWLAEWVERRIVRDFCYITAVSAREAAVFQRFAPNSEVVVVPNGVDLARFPATSPSTDGATVMLLGAMEYLPNRDSALYFNDAIWPSVRAECPRARLVVLGKSAPARLPELRHIPGVEVKEPVSEIQTELAAASVMVVPLRAGGGTRIKILESLAMAKAVVTTGVGAEGLDVVSGRDLIICDDPRDFARAVAELLRNPERRRELGSNGRRLVEERYGWDRAAAILESLCVSVANGHSN